LSAQLYGQVRYGEIRQGKESSGANQQGLEKGLSTRSERLLIWRE
jgi:hypothetical protein